MYKPGLSGFSTFGEMCSTLGDMCTVSEGRAAEGVSILGFASTLASTGAATASITGFGLGT